MSDIFGSAAEILLLFRQLYRLYTISRAACPSPQLRFLQIEA